jgi:hypothetical protein
VRRLTAITLLIAMTAVRAEAQPAATQLELGLRAFRAADYASAAVDLESAARAALTSEALQPFILDGSKEPLETLQTALVYLALAQFRMGREDAARETIGRLAAAERIAPVFETLPLQTDATEFEALAVALVPGSNLPRNVHLAGSDPSRPLPPITRRTSEPAVDPGQARTARQASADALLSLAELTTPLPQVAAAPGPERPVEPIPVQAPPPAMIPAPAPPAPSAADRERLAQEQAEMAARIAAAQAEADRRIAAIEAEARRRIAAAEARAVQAEHEAQAARATEAPVAGSSDERTLLLDLRQAEALAGNGATDRAVAIYRRVASGATVPREFVAEAAIGLYRVGFFRDAADILGRMGAFGRGEEDLRYYYAVALFETGQYEQARRELDCALPFIQINDEVNRYRMRIQQASAMNAPTR